MTIADPEDVRALATAARKLLDKKGWQSAADFGRLEEALKRVEAAISEEAA